LPWVDGDAQHDWLGSPALLGRSPAGAARTGLAKLRLVSDTVADQPHRA